MSWSEPTQATAITVAASSQSAAWFAIVPVGKKSARSLPSSAIDSGSGGEIEAPCLLGGENCDGQCKVMVKVPEGTPSGRDSVKVRPATSRIPITST